VHQQQVNTGGHVEPEGGEDRSKGFQGLAQSLGLHMRMACDPWTARMATSLPHNTKGNKASFYFSLPVLKGLPWWSLFL
jgi:hypothetical protein